MVSLHPCSKEMKKLELLRQHLINRIPGLKKSPERLLTFIERGTIECHRGETLSHEYSMPVRIVLTDYSDEIDAVMIPLLQWLCHYQPDLDPQQAINFDAEILSNNAFDLALEVRLTERVIAKVDCEQGRIISEHRTPEFPVDACPATSWEVFLKDHSAENDYRLIAQWQGAI